MSPKTQTESKQTDAPAPISWSNETRRLGDLQPWPRNPRQIRTAEARRLKQSLDDFGQVDIIAIGPNNEVYNGHQRIAVWQRAYGPDYEVDVRVASRPLSERERERLTVLLHKGAMGEWDFDALANEFEITDLLEWGFEERDLQIAGILEAEAEAKKDEEIKGRLTISPELFERHDYLLFYFDNEFDWQVACELFNIGPVLDGQVGGKTLLPHGIGRVVPGSRLLEKLQND